MLRAVCCIEQGQGREKLSITKLIFPCARTPTWIVIKKRFVSGTMHKSKNNRPPFSFDQFYHILIYIYTTFKEITYLLTVIKRNKNNNLLERGEQDRWNIFTKNFSIKKIWILKNRSFDFISNRCVVPLSQIRTSTCGYLRTRKYEVWTKVWLQLFYPVVPLSEQGSFRLYGCHEFPF